MQGRIATMTFVARAVLLLTALASSPVLTGCSGGDDPGTPSAGEPGREDQGMNPVEGGADDTLLASLAFDSAADDARHRCLFETLSASAAGEGLEPLDTFERRGAVHKLWCDASGRDGNDCRRGFVDGFEGRGSRAIALTARREAADEVVTRYGYEASRTPAEGAGTWSLAFERRLGDEDAFVARFVPFGESGRNDAGQIALFERFGYGTEELAVLYEETYASPDALLSALAESPERFEQIVLERVDTTLEAFVEKANAPGNGFEPGRRDELIAGAQAFLGRMRDVVEADGKELHALLSEQVLLDECR